MDGFLYVVAPDGQCLYISDNITHYMGLSQVIYLFLSLIFTSNKNISIMAYTSENRTSRLTE